MSNMSNIHNYVEVKPAKPQYRPTLRVGGGQW